MSISSGTSLLVRWFEAELDMEGQIVDVADRTEGVDASCAAPLQRFDGAHQPKLVDHVWAIASYYTIPVPSP